MKQEYYRYGLILVFLITVFSVVMAILSWKKIQVPQPDITGTSLFPSPIAKPVEDKTNTTSVIPSPSTTVSEGFTAPECKRTGCSSQFCINASAADVVSTCEYLEQYACYRQARCEVQPNGECGFTQTTELQQCLANAPAYFQ